MSIVEFSNGISRNKIGFVDTIPPDAISMLERLGYTCVSLDRHIPHDSKSLWDLDCLILIQDSDNPKGITGDIKIFAPQVLPRDCRIYIKPFVSLDSRELGLSAHRSILSAINAYSVPYSGVSEVNRASFGDWDEGPNFSALGPFLHLLEGRDDWNQIAKVIRGNPASAAPVILIGIINGKDRNGQKLKLDDEQECLLLRAFKDCASVELVALGNGLSEVDTYKAYVHLSNNQVTQSWPYVYFVKLGKRKNIATEYRKYLSHTLDHVPYHLGPKLRQNRCALGHKLGIIVTDYVHYAETLRDCARDQRAGSVIGNLFSNTLRNWHTSASRDDLDIQLYLQKYVERDPPKHRTETIHLLGATTDIEELRTLLKNYVSKTALVGVIHGDLHATNVLVRANDAVIIDFEKLEVNRSPLLYDVASLEGGLFVDGFIGDKRTGSELLESIEKLYQPSSFDGDILTYSANNESAWFFECVRHLRMHAREKETESRQYGWVLAAVLIKKSCNPAKFDAPEDNPPAGLSREQVRALAYVLAERLLVGLN